MEPQKIDPIVRFKIRESGREIDASKVDLTIEEFKKKYAVLRDSGVDLDNLYLVIQERRKKLGLTGNPKYNTEEEKQPEETKDNASTDKPKRGKKTIVPGTPDAGSSEG